MACESRRDYELYEVGAAAVEITPPVGTPLAGNVRDDYASRGVHDPLYARALAIRQGETAVALVIADLLTAPAALVDRVRAAVATRCGLQAGQILVAATHTHSGPAVEALAGPDCAATVIEQVVPGMVQACVAAVCSAMPMQLWSTTAHGEDLFFNRRLRLNDGRTAMNWTMPLSQDVAGPLGPVDPTIGVLLATPADQPADAAPRVVLVNAALHAAVLAGDNSQISADWPGYCCRAVETVFGSQTTSLFLQGAEGNVNHIDATDYLQGRGFKEAQRIGTAVAVAAASARFDAQPVYGPVACSSLTVELPPRRIDARMLAEAQALADRAAGSEPAGQVDGIPALWFARDQLQLAERTEPYRAEIQVLRIGNLAIVGLPGEFFVEFGLQIKQCSPARQTLIAGLANGSLGYVPTAAAFAEGGYEPTTWRYSRLDPEAGAACVAAARRQLDTLFAVSDAAR